MAMPMPRFPNVDANLEISASASRETLAQVFSCEFCEISKNIFLRNTSEQLLLNQ